MAALDGERDSAGFNFGRAILGASGGAPALAVPDLAGHGAQGEPQPQQDQQDQQEAPPPPPPRLRVAPPEAPVAVELLPNSLSLQWSQCSVTVQARELRVVNYVLLYELSMQQVEGNSSSTAEAVVKSDRWSVQYVGQATYVQVKGLRPGRRYAVRVACRPQVEDPEVVVELAEPSPVALVCTPPTPPGPLAVPGLAGRQKRQLTYKWAEPEETGGRPILEYQLQMLPPPEGWQGPPAPGSEGFSEVFRGPQSRFAAQPLLPGVRYAARVRAVNSEGLGPWSPVCNYFTSAGVPSPPSYLALADASADSVTLQWDTPFDGGSEITSYELEMDDGRGGEFSLAHRAPPGSTRHTILHLRSGVAYRFRVRAESTMGKGTWSPTCAVHTAATSPDAPSTLAKLGCNRNSISIAWQEPEQDGGSPVQGYEVEMRPKCASAKCGMEDGWLTIYQGHTKSCTLGGLPAGCTFRVRVRAFNATGAGEYCQPVDLATAPDIPAPPPPPTVTSRQQTAVGVAWAPPEHDGGSAVASYRLEQRCLGRVEELALPPGAGKGKAQADPSFQAAYLGPERSCELRDLEPGMRHELRLLAINTQGASPWSPPVRVDTKPGPPFPPEPPELAAAASSTALQLCWVRPYGQGAVVNNYILQVCTRRALLEAQQLAAAAVAAAAAPSITPATAPAAAPAAAAAAAAAPAAAPVADGRANGHANGAADPSSSAPSTTSGSEACTTSLPPGDGSDAAFVTVYHGSTPAFTAKDLEPDCEYAFRLKACNAVGSSPWASVQVLRTAPAAPSSPTSVALSEPPTSRSVALAWQPPQQDFGAAVSSYQVEWASVLRASRSVSSWRTAYTGPDVTCRLEGLKPGQQVQLRVRAANIVGWGAWAPPVTATVAADVPEAPEPPSSSNRTASSVRLKWQPPAEDNGAAVMQYVVELASAASGGTFQAAYTGEATCCKLQQLLPGTEYSCRVAAVNLQGKGPSSAATRFTTALAPPLAPTSVEAAVDGEVGPATVTVTWGATAAAAGAGAVAEEPEPEQQGEQRATCISYEVEAVPRAGDGPAHTLKPVSKTCSARLTQLTLGPLQPGSYEVHVRSIGADGAGHGEWSSKVLIAVAKPAAPAPGAASAAAGSSDAEGGGDVRLQRKRSSRLIGEDEPGGHISSGRAAVAGGPSSSGRVAMAAVTAVAAKPRKVSRWKALLTWVAQALHTTPQALSWGLKWTGGLAWLFFMLFLAWYGWQKANLEVRLIVVILLLSGVGLLVAFIWGKKTEELDKRGKKARPARDAPRTKKR